MRRGRGKRIRREEGEEEERRGEREREGRFCGFLDSALLAHLCL